MLRGPKPRAEALKKKIRIILTVAIVDSQHSGSADYHRASVLQSPDLSGFSKFKVHVGKYSNIRYTYGLGTANCGASTSVGVADRIHKTFDSVSATRPVDFIIRFAPPN